MTSFQPVSDTRVVTTLSLLYMFRMLGLFMVFPVLAVFGDEYHGATPLLLGMALGAYGLTQALFQVPLGLLSDLFGRKPVILAGLVLFVAGSVIAALADSVWGLLAGRFIQGAGAIASAVMALLGDLTSEQNRTRAMAVVGVSIGVSFSIAMVAGPLLAGAFGISSVFWASALLACVGIATLLLLVPSPAVSRPHADHRAVPGMLASVLKNPDLARINVGIFVLHFALTATFVVVPLALTGAGARAAQHWHYYLPVMVCAFILMLPFIYLAERKRKFKRVFLAAVAGIAASELWLSSATYLWQWVLGLLMFFVAFNLLEATLPSLVSKQAPAGSKGTAMGVYSTCQFLGASLGGIAGGFMYSQFSFAGPLLLSAALCGLWWLVALAMRPPRFLTSVVVPCDTPVREQAVCDTVPGVAEAHWVREHGALYLKVDRQHFDKVFLMSYLGRTV